MHRSGDDPNILTFQELVRPFDPQVDVLGVFGAHLHDVRVGVVAGAKVKQWTRLGERQRGEQVDEEHDQQQHQEAADVLVNFLFCIVDVGRVVVVIDDGVRVDEPGGDS